MDQPVYPRAENDGHDGDEQKTAEQRVERGEQLGELTVEAESTAWATQLRLLAGSLLRRIAAEVGHDVVRRLHIHGPAAPSFGSAVLAKSSRAKSPNAQIKKRVFACSAISSAAARRRRWTEFLRHVSELKPFS